MSHTPILASGSVIKRKLNAIRPVSGGGPVPPSGLVFFNAETLVPVPANEPSGAALAERVLFDSYLTTVSPETFEEFDIEGGGLDMGDVPLFSNGNEFHFTLVSNVTGFNANANGRYNTTPGGVYYVVMSSGGADIELVFDTFVAGFGAYFSDMGDFTKAWTATITDENDAVTVVPFDNTVDGPNGSLIFWGWLDNSGLLYKSVSFQASGGGVQSDGVGIDDIITPSTADINFG